MIKDFNDLIEKAKSIEKSTVCIAGAEDRELLKAIKLGTDIGFIKSILVGNMEEIKGIVKEIGLKDYEIINAEGAEEAALVAVKIVKSGRAKILMKGLINTSIYMRAILNREFGLRTKRLLSLMAVYDIPSYHKLLYCTDSGVNVSPSLEQKKDILTNTLMAIGEMGLKMPKVAALTANEIVDPKIQATVDAGELVEMVKKGKIPQCIIEGPIAFDVAFSKSSAEHKGINSKIAGDVDVLMFSNMETGNVLGKSWLHFNNAKWAGIILGGTNPIILGSRSDTAEIKINSIALACLISNI